MTGSIQSELQHNDNPGTDRKDHPTDSPCLLYTSFFEGAGFVEAFSGSDASVGLVLGSFFGFVITIILYLVRRVLKFGE